MIESSMTHLIIHHDIPLRRAYLLQQVNKILGMQYTQITQFMSNPDIHIIEHPEQTAISISDVKQLQKEMIFRPFQEAYQMAIIYHADNLTIEAQNALLKTLEEQSINTLYFLMISNEKNLLDTIISRGIKHYVKSELHEAENKDQTPITKPEILDKDLYQQFADLEQLVEIEKEDKTVIKEFLNQLSNYFRNQMRSKIREGNNRKSKELHLILKEIEKAGIRIGANVNKRLTLENLFLSIHQLSPRSKMD